jgi:hypothetical protein
MVPFGFHAEPLSQRWEHSQGVSFCADTCAVNGRQVSRVKNLRYLSRVWTRLQFGELCPELPCPLILGMRNCFINLDYNYE